MKTLLAFLICIAAALTTRAATSFSVMANTNGNLTSPMNFFTSNLIAGANITLTPGASGKLIIAGEASGGGGTGEVSTAQLNTTSNALRTASIGMTNALAGVVTANINTTSNILLTGYVSATNDLAGVLRARMDAGTNALAGVVAVNITTTSNALRNLTVTATNDLDTVLRALIAGAGGSGSGETNTMSSTGSGVGINNAKAGVNLPIKSFTDSSALLTWTTNANEIDLAFDWVTATNGLATVAYANTVTQALSTVLTANLNSASNAVRTAAIGMTNDLSTVVNVNLNAASNAVRTAAIGMTNALAGVVTANLSSTSNTLYSAISGGSSSNAISNLNGRGTNTTLRASTNILTVLDGRITFEGDQGVGGGTNSIYSSDTGVPVLLNHLLQARTNMNPMAGELISWTDASYWFPPKVWFESTSQFLNGVLRSGLSLTNVTVRGVSMPHLPPGQLLATDSASWGTNSGVDAVLATNLVGLTGPIQAQLDMKVSSTSQATETNAIWTAFKGAWVSNSDPATIDLITNKHQIIVFTAATNAPVFTGTNNGEWAVIEVRVPSPVTINWPSGIAWHDGAPTNFYGGTTNHYFFQVVGTERKLTGWFTGIAGLATTNYVDAAIAGVTAGVAVSDTNKLFVRIGGSDATALRGRQDKPFATLTNAAANALSGDVIVVGAGTFHLNGTRLTLPDNVDLVGVGMGASVINGDGALGTALQGPLINPGDNSYISGLSVFGTNDSVLEGFQAAIGVNTPSLQPFTNVVVEGCQLYGGSDTLYIETNLVCSIKLRNCLIQAEYDNIYVNGNTNHMVEIENSTIELRGFLLELHNGAWFGDNQTRRNINNHQGRVKVSNSRISALNGDKTTLNVNNMTNGVTELWSCALASSSTNAIGTFTIGTATNSAGRLVLYECSGFDPSKIYNANGGTLLVSNIFQPIIGGTNITVTTLITNGIPTRVLSVSAAIESSVSDTNKLFVRIGGSDATALRGRFDRPFATLTNAAANALSGDTIVVGAGTFNLNGTRLTLPDNVNLAGVGMGMSVINGNGALGGALQGPMINPGDNSYISGLSVFGTNDSVLETFQAAIGANTPSLQPFTNVLVESCQLYGGADTVYIETNKVCSIKFRNCLIQGEYDNVYVNGHASHLVEIEHCTLESKIFLLELHNGAWFGDNGIRRNIVAHQGRVKISNSSLSALNGENTCLNVLNSTNAVTELWSCALKSSSTNTSATTPTFGTATNTAGTLILYECSGFDQAKLFNANSGTLLVSNVAPRVASVGNIVVTTLITNGLPTYELSLTALASNTLYFSTNIVSQTIGTNNGAFTNITLNADYPKQEVWLTNNVSLTNWTGIVSGTAKDVRVHIMPQLVNRTITYPVFSAPALGMYWRTNVNSPMYTTFTNGVSHVISVSTRGTNAFVSLTLW